MFWRLGSLDDSRPVAATAWLNEVCRRPVLRVDERRQRVDVRALELRQRPVLDDLRGHRVQRRQLLQRVGVGRRAGLGLADHGQRQLAEQHLAELLGRVDVEGSARQARESPAPARPATCPTSCADLAQLVGVERDAARLDLAPARARAAARGRGRAVRGRAPPAWRRGAPPAPAPRPPRRRAGAPTSSAEMSAPGRADAPVPIQVPAAGDRDPPRRRATTSRS